MHSVGLPINFERMQIHSESTLLHEINSSMTEFPIIYKSAH